ncbi:Folylpolyglutamate synthase [Dirofilaria immitis]
MFSSVRDGYYQELRRQRRQTSPHLKNSRESSISTERIVGYPESNIKLANHRFENGCCNNYDQVITARNRFQQSLSMTNDGKRKFSNHRASLLAENILNRQAQSATTAISNLSFPKSNSTNDFIAILPATTSPFGIMDDNYRNSQMKHINQIITPCCTATINKPINESTINQSFQKSTTVDNYDANKSQNFRQLSSESSQSAITSKPFDPNQIIDDFMNDRYNV